MWRTQDGDRALTDAEWECFRAGLDLLRDFVEGDIASGGDDAGTGVPVFDRLTAEQKLALLADVAAAVRDPAVPPPRHTAANEGAVVAVLATFEDMLRAEVEAGEPGRTDLRECLLRAAADSEDRPGRLPRATSRKWGRWADLHDTLLGRILWDSDYALGDKFLDLPPDKARAKLDAYGIDEDYYLHTPPEPDGRGLAAARRTLAGLIGLAAPDEDGLYPGLDDLYHGLTVGPVPEDEAAAFAGHPWVWATGSSEPGWDCDYARWRAEFAGAVPAAPFRVDPAGSTTGPGRTGAGWSRTGGLPRRARRCRPCRSRPRPTPGPPSPRPTPCTTSGPGGCRRRSPASAPGRGREGVHQGRVGATGMRAYA